MNQQAARQLGVKPFDSADYLKSEVDCLLYLLACVQVAPDDTAFIARAFDTISRAKVVA